MDPRLTIALLVVLAGCSGISGDPSGQSTVGDTPTQAPTTTASPPREATETTSTTFTPLESTESNTIEYTDLSSTEKQVFDEAVEFSAEFYGRGPHNDSEYYDPEIAQTFETHEWVVKNGSFYRISVYENLVPRYDVQATEAQPSDNATIVSLQNVSPPTRTYVRRAIQNGRYIVPLGESPPEDIEYGDYVRTANATYEIGVGHGDLLVTVVSAEEWG